MVLMLKKPFATGIKSSFLRLMLTVVASEDLELYVMVVKTACLHEHLSEDI